MDPIRLLLVGVAALLIAGGQAAAQQRAGLAGGAISAPRYSMDFEEVWITMPDGVRLAADVFLPAQGDAEDAPGVAGGERFPVLLEYLPYRKTEAIHRNYPLYHYFVSRGYIVARVDIRGTGRSEGAVPEYEYSEQEQRDGEVVIDWLSRQPWSTGNVGMWGISWGGFNSIHLAMRRPPALKAIIAIQAADDLFHDDVHYFDGLMHIDQFEIAMDLANALAPAPEFPLDEEVLRQRFDTEPWLLVYLRHQRDGPFWQRASLRGRYDELQIPTFVIGGWYDGYRDSVGRMLEHVPAPMKAIMGPWNHSLPHAAIPGPQIEWRHEAVRWWDHWLKGRDTGILDEPAFAVFVRHWHPPDPAIQEIPGEWRWEEGWPVERLEPRTLHFGSDRRLTADAPTEHVHELRYVPSAGVEAGFWWGEVVPDQRPVDAFSLVYETPPLDEDLEILGFPRAELRVSADARLANWFVRISDVAPDQTVTQVAGAGKAGAHRFSRERPESLVPGQYIDLDIDLHMTSWVFPRGHRIRVAVSNALWPMIWPTPYSMTTTLRLGGGDGSRITLPIVPATNPPPAGRPDFLPPEPQPRYPGAGGGTGGAWPGEWTVQRDEVAQATTVAWKGDSHTQHSWGAVEHREVITYFVRDDDPAHSTVTGDVETIVHLSDRTLTWLGTLRVRSDESHMHYDYTRRLLRDGSPIRERNWVESIPRDHH